MKFAISDSGVREIFVDWIGSAFATACRANCQGLAEMPGSLTSDQLKSYHEDGFVKPIRAFSSERALEIRKDIEQIERECAEADKPVDINQYFRVNGQIVIPLLYEITRTEPVLDAVESVLGPNLLAWSCELFIKDAGSEKIVSWHQDMTYWGMGGSDKQATAWIAITNVSEEAGCMRFVPGSHKQQLIPHIDKFAEDNLLSRGQEVAIDVDEEEAVLDELAPGEMSIHHGRIFHASGPNRSADRRIGIAIRYVAPDLERSASVRDYAILVRGVDECGSWINATPPKELFGKSEMATYKLITEAQASFMSAGAEQAVPLYGVA